MIAKDLSQEIAWLRSRLAAEEHKLKSVQEIGAALVGALDFDRMLSLIMEKVTHLLDADRSTLYLMTDDGQFLWSKVAQGDGFQTIRLALGEGIAGWVAQSGELVNIVDAYADPRFQSEVDRATGYRTQSILCTPIRNHLGAIVSIIQVLNKRGGPFTGDDETLLRTLATQVAISIENSKLYQAVVDKNARLLETQEKLQQKMFELDVLFAVEREMHQALSLDEMLGRLLSHAVELVGGQAGMILIRENEVDTFHVRLSRSGEAQVQRHPVGVEDSVAGWATERNQVLLLEPGAPELGGAVRFWEKHGLMPRNVLCVPLAAKAEVCGAIELVNKRGREPFDEADRKLLTLVAAQATSAIELERGKEERLKQSRLASLGQALSSVMHDLKTPMTIISGYAQLMAQIDDAAQRGQYVTQILKQFDHMDAMAREILAFARGESHLLIQRIYLQEFLEEIMAELRQTCEHNGVKLIGDLAYQGVAFFDETKLRRVISNIARNAIEAMVGCKDPTFTFSSKTERDKLVFTFRDNGPGIPTEVRGKLFDVFASAGKKEGTGLGLAIVKRIVDEHGGEVSVETVPGQGTTFWVVLPLERTGRMKKVSRRVSMQR